MNDRGKHRWVSIVAAPFIAISALLILDQVILRAADEPAPVPAAPAAPANGPAFTAVVTDDLPVVDSSSVAWGDYDNDGDLDILLTGASGGIYATVYSNDGADGSSGGWTFTEAVTDTLTGVYHSSVAWGDYDNDGDLDILLTGQSDGGGTRVSKVYRNDSSGIFTDIGATLTDVRASSVAWGDYDNDGDLDILLTGNGSGGRVSKVYRNDGASTFTDIGAGLTGVDRSSVAWGDYDNDGDLDILLTGDSGVGYVSKVYRNDGSSTFTDISATLTDVSYGSAAWGDYDNDGDLDILLTGYDGASFVAMAYRNEGADTFIDIGAALTGVYLSSVAWGDYDNDGDLDILLIGSDGSPVTRIYRNEGADTFVTAVTTDTLIGVRNGSVAWGDYDGDGDLDILLTGWDGSNSVTTIYRNNTTTVNSVPAAPGDLSAQVLGNTVELGWAAPSPTATTPITGLTYNLYVGTAPGKTDIVAPMAFTVTDPLTNGLRLLPALGNAQHGLTATLTGLAESTYYWSVQAVDHTFAGSPFAVEGQFIVGNQPPAADAGSDQSVNTNALVTLDGSESSDPDGHLPLTYGWAQTGGPAVTFNGALSVTTFTASGDPTVLTFTLAVTDSLGLPDLTPDEVVITVNNQAPVADAGGDQSVGTGAPVTLDGSGSSDPDADLPLTYGWTQTGGPAVTFNDALSITTFTAPGTPGVLTFTLTVTDSLGLPDPTPDEVVITVNNQAPVADAGGDQSVNTNAIVTLDGSGSSDPDGDLPLTYGWTQTGGTAVTFNDALSITSFTAPGDPGVLTFTLTVTDALGLASTPDEVVVTVNNQAPVADAGGDQSVGTGAPVTLDGSSSSDPDGDLPLTYGWTQTGGPAVTLSNPTIVAPTFTAPSDPVVLIFTLAVTDSLGLPDPTPDQVVVTVNNQPPIADAGSDQSVDTNTLVTLDGSNSSDPDGDLPLTYYWTQTGGPAVTLSNPTVVAPTFTALSDPAVLTFTLLVIDSLGLPDLTPDQVVITINNQAPVANAGSDQSVDTNAPVTLNGSGSSDPDGDLPLTYHWTQIGGPMVTLSSPAAAQPTFTAPDAPAVLTFTLAVTDSLGLPGPTPDEVVVTVEEYRIYLPLVVRQTSPSAEVITLRDSQRHQTPRMEQALKATFALPRSILVLATGLIRRRH